MKRVHPAGAFLLAIACAAAGCERDARRYQQTPTGPPGMATGIRQTPFQPGKSEDLPQGHSPYQQNAFGISEGKRLFSQFNCTGCHAHGGGGIGPALMDDKWIYGAAPQQIYSTIVEGRPNGMPAFGGRVPDHEVWQLVAYIQSLGVQVPRDASPSRDDDMSVMKPELRLEPQTPKQTGHR